MKPCNAQKMKALSVRQPFAGLIAAGIKRLEIRGWQTDYRGPILICASKREHPLFVSYHYRSGLLEIRNSSAPRKIQVELGQISILGAALCVVDLVDVNPFVQEQEKSACIDWIPAAFAWHLENPRPILRPLPVLGKPKFFEFDDSLIVY